MGHHDWLIRVGSGPPVRVKRWPDVVPDEVFQESMCSAAPGIMAALSHSNNAVVADQIYTDIVGARHHRVGATLDAKAWATLRRAFQTARYVLVPLHVDPKKASWEAVSLDDRRVYVMRLLTDQYGYPQNAAAGIVGNVEAESSILPNRIEGSRATSPLRALSLANPNGKPTDFTPTEVMNRSTKTATGPLKPGIGLAQWTASVRRKGLFQRKAAGVPLGADVVRDMDAQVAYLVSEMKHWGGNLQARLIAAKSVEDACDLITYEFETPGSVLSPPDFKKKLPMADPAVQRVFEGRRPLARAASEAFTDAQATP